MTILEGLQQKMPNADRESAGGFEILTLWSNLWANKINYTPQIRVVFINVHNGCRTSISSEVRSNGLTQM